GAHRCRRGRRGLDPGRKHRHRRQRPLDCRPAMTVATVLSRVLLVLALLGPIVDLDHDVQRAVQDGRRPGLESLMRGASNSRQGAMVMGILLIVAIGTGPAGPATARAALFALLPVNAATEVIKRAAHRLRPDGTGGGSNASFP